MQRNEVKMMANVRRILNTIINFLTGISFLAMVVLVVGQVCTRYIFNQPATWTEELVSYLFAWASLLGACLVTGDRDHMAISFMLHYCSKRMRIFWNIFGEVVAVLFSLVILVFGGVQITNLAMGQLTSSLGVAVGVFYVILPIAGVLNTVYAVLNIIDILQTGQCTTEEDEEED